MRKSNQIQNNRHLDTSSMDNNNRYEFTECKIKKHHNIVVGIIIISNIDVQWIDTSLDTFKNLRNQIPSSW